MDVDQLQTAVDARPRVMAVPLYRLLIACVIVYFLGFGFLMANLSGQPDQGAHLYFSFRFGETWGIPKEDPTSAFAITGNPYLYYWLNGAALKLFRIVLPGASSGQQTLLLRILSLCMSAATLVYVYKLAAKVTGNRYAGVLAAFFMANTLMFVFVSSGVTYDNFMDLASAAAIYHIVNIFKREDYVRNTMLAGIWLCLGALAKEQGLLLAFILFIAWLAYSIRSRKELSFSFDQRNIAITAIFLVCLVLFLVFYGANVVHYHHLIARCEQVKPAQACTLFASRQPLYHALNLGQLWNNRESIPNPISYALSFWIIQMLASIWGVLSHNTFVPWLSISLHGLLILLGALCTVRYWKREDRIPTLLLLILLAYTGYIWMMNYVSEMHYDFNHFGIQGRYLFPILGVLFSVMINYFLRISSLFLRRTVITLSIMVYFFGGLGLFLFRYAQVFSYWRLYF